MNNCSYCGASTLHRAHMYGNGMQLCSICEVMKANAHPFWGDKRGIPIRRMIEKYYEKKIESGDGKCRILLRTDQLNQEQEGHCPKDGTLK